MIAVRAPDDLPRAVHGIYALVRRGHRVVAQSTAPDLLSSALREAGLGQGSVEVVRHARGAGPLPDLRTERALRVALLGHGTVGTGLYRRLTELPDLFHVTGIAVRDPRKAERAGAPARLLSDDCWRVLKKSCHVVVELIGGSDPAARIIEGSLREGRHVVTANKAVIAARGPYLESVARGAGAQLLYSASVGGAMPALETLRRLAGRVTSFSGVLNATTNFVLDQMAGGLSLAEAVQLAQKAGYAEADPKLDLDGTDAAQKLLILARAAFGRAPEHLFQSGIEDLRPAQVASRRVRLVASCDGHRGEVRALDLPQRHPLADCAGAENRLLVHLADGPPLFLSATGAGRWPTAEAVLADLLDLGAGTECREAEQAPTAA
jgi:homoserine dehydrogenase